MQSKIRFVKKLRLNIQRNKEIKDTLEDLKFQIKGYSAKKERMMNIEAEKIEGKKLIFIDEVQQNEEEKEVKEVKEKEEEKQKEEDKIEDKDIKIEEKKDTEKEEENEKKGKEEENKK